MTELRFPGLSTELESFWSRSYSEDVKLLNRELSKAGDGDAGLITAPPSVLTGDPFSLAERECLLVFGINPKWRASDSEFQSNEMELSSTAWAGRDFERYRRDRATYFEPGSALYYGRYFTRLGNALAHGFMGVSPPARNAAEAAKRFLARHVVKLDILPWWSADVKRIRGDSVTPRLPPIGAWRSVIDVAIAEMKPRAIIVNGCGWRRAIEGLFDCNLKRFSFESAAGKGSYAYQATINDTPLLAHSQLGSAGAGSHDDYLAMVRAWRSLCSRPGEPVSPADHLSVSPESEHKRSPTDFNED